MYIRKKKEPVRVPFDAGHRSTHCLEPIFPKKRCWITLKRLNLDYDEETNEDYRTDLPSGSVPRLQIWQRKWQDSMDMTIFRPHCRPERQPQENFPTSFESKNVARDIAEFCGFCQGMTYSFESPKVFDKLLIPADSQLRRSNPDYRIRWERITVSCEPLP